MVKLKAGVDARLLSIKLASHLTNLEWIFRYHTNPDWDLTITSASEGQHSTGSLHYVHKAVDLRTKYRAIDGSWEKLPWECIGRIVADIQRLLGEDYDIVDEGTHIHIEFDPS